MLAPFDPYLGMFESIYTIAHLIKGDYAKAATVGRRAVMTNPDFTAAYKPFIAALGHLGRTAEARDFLARLLQREPHFSIASFAATCHFQQTAHRDLYFEGLRRAGVAEKS
jgi:adenylate cyclase